MSPVGLGELLAGLPQNRDPNLLVGFHTSDDAGIYRLDDRTAIVMTADFITPPVNDPFVFGQIAAANALSDVYAMGGKPLACLNLVAFPSKKLPQESLRQILAGGLSKITEAGAVLAGGHSIDDDEPKYGLSVTGIVHPEKYWTNAGVRVGDALILTKPVGSGVLFNAALKKWVSARAMDACIDIITTLNRIAAEVLATFEIHAATDVTGFGIAGHGHEMATGSGVCLEIEIENLPVMVEALDMYRRGMSTGVNAANRSMVKADARFETDLPPWHREIVFDPQTNGGLMAAVPEVQAQPLVAALHAAGIADAGIIGRAIESTDGTRLAFK
ncbi:MAG: selenide, water dikinase SelD [Desulfobacterales bacterium]|nr:selenide, water dikinase SelD [Desulfobacterales bacterium]